MNETMRITHHGFPGGYVINASEFVTSTMTPWAPPAPELELAPDPKPAPKPRVEKKVAPEAG